MGRRAFLIMATGLVALALVGVALVRSGNHSVSPPTSTATSAATSGPGTTLGRDVPKAPIVGFLDRTGPPAPGAPLQGFVINANWADVQPSGPSDLVTATIDSQLALASQRHQVVKLRVFSGIAVPDWLKTETGPPVSVTEPASGQTGTIGRYWTTPFGRAYENLETMLAARYDHVPELREVTVSRCSTVFSETFLRNARDTATLAALVAAGLTAAADKACIKSEIAAHQVWKQTRTGVAFNPFQALGPDGSSVIDEPFTEQMIDYCRRLLGPRCVLENNSLRSPPLAGYQAMYNHMRALGAPIAFQTAALRRVGDLAATIDLAISLGASSVELPSSYDPGALSPAAVAAMQANASP